MTVDPDADWLDDEDEDEDIDMDAVAAQLAEMLRPDEDEGRANCGRCGERHDIDTLRLTEKDVWVCPGCVRRMSKTRTHPPVRPGRTWQVDGRLDHRKRVAG